MVEEEPNPIGASGAADADGSGSTGMSGSVTANLSVAPDPVAANDSEVASDPAIANDPVAARRMAHGLSPEVGGASKKAVQDGRRKESDAVIEERKRKLSRQSRARVIRNTTIAIVVIVIAGTIFGFWLLRWGLHDDVSSIQGQWRVQGTDTVIEINEEDIVLTNEVAYDYVLDPNDKTLSFRFGALSGSGRYRFSLDHNMLAIDDGEFDFVETLMADIPWTTEAFFQKLVGKGEKSPELEDGDMVLERIG